MKKSDKTFDEIELAQAKMRECIETAKGLSDQSDKLIKRHRREKAAEATLPASGRASAQSHKR